MTQEEFDEKMNAHFIWANSKGKDGKQLACKNECFSNLEFSGWQLSEASFIDCDFSNMAISDIIFKGANLTGCKFDGSKIAYCDFSRAYMPRTFFTNAIIYSSNFNGIRGIKAKINKAMVINCDFSNTSLMAMDFDNSILTNSNFTNTTIDTDTSFNGTNFSGVRGLVSPIDYMAENFEKNNKTSGYYAYKVFGAYRMPPSYWEIKKGSIITETACFDRRDICACGINVSTLDCLYGRAQASPEKFKKIWKVYIAPEWLPGVIVPFSTIGDIRCEKCQLVEEYTYEELFGERENEDLD